MTGELIPIGNGRFLARVRDNCSIADAFFPSLSLSHHFLQSRLALIGVKGSRPLWLSDEGWRRHQSFTEGSNALVSELQLDGVGVRVTDLCPEGYCCLVRRVEVINHRGDPAELALCYASATGMEDNEGDFRSNTVYWQPARQALVHYRGHPFDNTQEGRTVLLVQPTPAPDEFQCGVSYEKDSAAEDAFEDLEDGELRGNDFAASSDSGVTTAFLWRLKLAPGERAVCTICLVGGRDFQAASEELDRVRAMSPVDLLSQGVHADQRWSERARHNAERIPDELLQQTYVRSLLFMRLLQDAQSGAIIAAPSIAPDYRFCWPRDGAFIANAFDRAGYHSESRAFWDWCTRTQSGDGLWHQNYFTDGRRHWPAIQMDQVGSILWGVGQHVKLTGDRLFADSVLPMVEKGAQCILDRRDDETGLVYSDQDLWEEASGQFAYTNASCVAALCAAADLLQDIDPTGAGRYRTEATRLREAIDEHLRVHGRYVGEVNPTHRHPGRADYDLDISLLGLSVPFDVLGPEDAAMQHTVASVADSMQYDIGGLGRYASDLFQGGNPWGLASLWLALFHARRGEQKAALERLDWALRHRTPAGFFPEQNHRHSGHPVSATPLGWAHAWFVLLMHELYIDAG